MLTFADSFEIPNSYNNLNSALLTLFSGKKLNLETLSHLMATQMIGRKIKI